MNATHAKAWTPENLARFGYTLGIGYDPGLGNKTPQGQTWSNQTQLRIATMLGQGYNPGL